LVARSESGLFKREKLNDVHFVKRQWPWCRFLGKLIERCSSFWEKTMIRILSVRNLFVGLLAWIGLLAGVPARAAGLLVPADGSLPALEIRDHQVQVVIEDGYAITTVEQAFHNPHSQDLEAIYSFPVPEKGSVADFTLWIDGKPVTGEVVEKQEAKRIYEEEKAAGRDAGLTEKDAYKTFEVKVSPVRAGQDTRLRLAYLQPAHVDTGIGRYVYPLEEGGVDEEKLAFWTANDKVTGTFGFELLLKSAYPVDAVRLPDQPQALVQRHGDGEWTVSLGSSGGAAAVAEEGTAQPSGFNPGGAPSYTLDKDLLVYWRHQAGLPGSVDLVANKPDPNGRGSFMLVVTPGDDLKPITEGQDWVFVLDVSGSMRAKYPTLAEGVNKALGKLRPEDRFRVVLFNEYARELTSGFVQASAANVRHWADQVAAVQPNESTNLYAGLEMGLDALDADRTSGLILVSDGVANVGETRQRQFVELVRSKDVRLFTFIMGTCSPSSWGTAQTGLCSR